MVKDRKVLVTAIVLCLTIILSSCDVKQPKTDTPPSNDKVQIGLTLDSKVLERWIRDVNKFTSRAHELGAEVDVLTANGDVDTQLDQITHFIEAGKDVIVIVAVDCDTLKEPIEEARASGIKIICYDRLINDVQTDLYISFDNHQVGVLMGKTMAEEVKPGGKIMMICGPKSDSNAGVIEQAFLDTIKGKDLEVVQVSYAKGWLPEYAFQTVDSAFEGISDIDGVMCGNDGLAVQAITALAEKRLAGKVCVVGQDADVEACQKVVEDLQTMTVYKPIKDLAGQAAEYAVMLAQGLPLDDVDDTVDTGGYQIKQKLLEPVAVTKENMDEIIIDGGFHPKEDVYLNVGIK